MSELRIPGATRAAGPSVMEVARDREDVLVGDELVRHRLSSRVIHWTVAVFFFGALFTGMPIWSPVFGWMAYLFGGLSVCRWLHAWLGVAFSAASLLMFVHWFRDMMFDENDRRFNVFEYMKFSDKEDPNVGKYNAGQKFFFWAAGVGAVAVRVHPAPRSGLHRVLRRHRRTHLSGDRSGAGHVPLDHPRNGNQGVGPVASSTLVPGCDR
jgi:hypothetical protein